MVRKTNRASKTKAEAQADLDAYNEQKIVDIPSDDSINKMSVYVPSRSRFLDAVGVDNLRGAWDHLFLVVPTEQYSDYKTLASKNGFKLLACGAKGIAATRRWIGEHCQHNKFLMCDDDLRFFERPTQHPVTHAQDNRQLFKLTRPEFVSGMLVTVSRYLDEFKHVAISARQGNNNLPLPHIECARPLRALAYQRKQFLQCEHERVTIMEDFDITLQLLRQGFKNAILTCYAQDHFNTNMAGGCSDYRTLAVHEANVRKMASKAMHGEFVTLREKDNITGGEFGSRLELIIYWKKAYESALKSLGIPV